MTKRQITNNGLQNIIQKTNDQATRTPLKTGQELRCTRVAPVVLLLLQHGDKS
jgi:hypothetical protein